MTFLKTHWLDLVVTLVASGCTTAFAIGFAWALVGSRVASAEHRLDEIETSHVAETHWQVQQNTATIAATQADVRRSESELSQINTRLGVIESKLDTIAETLKRAGRETAE